MNDDLKPGQIIEPNSNKSDDSSSGDSASVKPAAFTPAPNPFENQPSSGGASIDNQTAPAAQPTPPPVVPTPAETEPLKEAPAVSPSETPPQPGSGHPVTPEPASQPPTPIPTPAPPVAPTPTAPPVVPAPDMTMENPLVSQSSENPIPAIAKEQTATPHTDAATAEASVQPAPLTPAATTAAPPPPEDKSDKKKKKNGFLVGLGFGKKEAAEAPKPSGPPVPETMHLNWQAPEFVQTSKPVGWYLLVGGFFLILIVLAVLTRQWISIGLFALMGATLAVYANRKPRVLDYTMSNLNTTVGTKKYAYSDFSAYYQTHDYNQAVFDLVPNKRFGTLVSLPAPHDLIDQIDEILASALPKTEPHDDAIDKLFRAMRF